MQQISYVNPHTVFRRVRRVRKTYTIRKLIDMDRAGQLHLTPAFQRGIAATDEWQQDFLSAMFNPITVTPLHLRKYTEEGMNYIWQVMDGLQRISTFRRFYDNGIKIQFNIAGPKDPINLRLMSRAEIEDLPDGHALIAAFFNMKLEVYEYGKMTDEQAAEVFCIINNNTDLNPEERRGAILGCVSDWVRYAAGYRGPGSVKDANQKLPVLDCIALGPGRKVWDDLIAKSLLHEMWHQKNEKGLGIYAYPCTHKNIVKFYWNDELRLKSAGAAKNLEPFTTGNEWRWGIVEKILKVYPKEAKLYTTSLSEVLTLYQLVCELEQEYGKTMIVDYKKFARKLWASLYELQDRNNTKYNLKPGDKTEFERYKNSANPALLMRKLTLLTVKLGDCGIRSRLKPNSRFFTRRQTAQQLQKQDFKCAVTGKPLDLIDADGGHIIPPKFGGDNSDKNLIAVERRINIKMGEMKFADFMKLYKKEA